MGSASTCPRCNSKSLKDITSMTPVEREEFFVKFPEVSGVACRHGKCCPECGWVEGHDTQERRRGAESSKDNKNQNLDSSLDA